MDRIVLDFISHTENWLRTNVLTTDSAIQWACVFGALALSFLLGKLLRPRFLRWVEESVSSEFLRSILILPSGIGYSLIFLLFAQISISVFVILDDFPRWLFAASDLAMAWIGIRLLTFIIPNKTLARTVALGVWGTTLLHIIGLLAHIKEYLTGLSLSLGDVHITVYGALKGLLLAALCLQIAAIVSKFTARRIGAFHDLSPSLQVLLTKLINIALYMAAILFALTSVGIDLTSLTIFSSAVGVGVGFGLKTIFSNYVSGVLLLVDKSIKPGDTIEIGGVFGTVMGMHGRYASILTRDGKEYLIPNEQMIAQEVINWTYSNANVRLVIPIGVAYKTDLRKAKELLQEAAKGVPRVLTFPEPAVRLVGFGNSSVDLELCIWIADTQDGVKNVKSAVLFNVWDLFHENNIEFPFPQRDVTIKAAPEMRVDVNNGNAESATPEEEKEPR